MSDNQSKRPTRSATHFLRAINEHLEFELDQDASRVEWDEEDERYSIDLIIPWTSTGLNIEILVEDDKSSLLATESGGSVGHPWHDEIYDIEWTEDTTAADVAKGILEALKD